jgi:hypothetical protein
MQISAKFANWSTFRDIAFRCRTFVFISELELEGLAISAVPFIPLPFRERESERRMMHDGALLMMTRLLLK